MAAQAVCRALEALQAVEAVWVMNSASGGAGQRRWRGLREASDLKHGCRERSLAGGGLFDGCTGEVADREIGIFVQFSLFVLDLVIDGFCVGKGQAQGEVEVDFEAIG
ncbi:uncharacterized protein A4U43_C03F11030 [Asparagus officinalis]|uniref:Uncharacterized protein n=1 Tax=Asparagus officinalis TaxID=4686 RepID=A0A5P1F908_ASPOF|nr:uncharacterized protein A4U43_C03F11030 [Asparagus officinalis]